MHQQRTPQRFRRACPEQTNSCRRDGWIAGAQPVRGTGEHGDARQLRFRRDGWTPQRQLRFLDALARSRSVTRAAAAAGMSRESAYRLRKRASATLFAAAWDRILAGPAPPRRKGHRRGKVRAWRQAVKDAGFAAFSTKGLP